MRYREAVMRVAGAARNSITPLEGRSRSGVEPSRTATNVKCAATDGATPAARDSRDAVRTGEGPVLGCSHRNSASTAIAAVANRGSQIREPLAGDAALSKYPCARN